MPLREKKKSNDNKSSVNYKARLERKLYLAQESPEPIFDISDCNVKLIPGNIFALCKVLRKEALYLQNNCITNLSSGGSLTDLKLLKVLNISCNKLNKLPDSINELQSLEVLDASQNDLQSLPDTIGDLKNLTQLNIASNILKCLPNSIGNCRNIEFLNIKNNENLKSLPATVGRLTQLQQLDFDSSITYPPEEVYVKGIQEIIKFLLKDLKEDFEIPSTSVKVKKSIPNFDNLQEKIELHEKLKEEKKNERLKLEKELLEQSQRELEAHQKLQKNKKKLIEEVKNQQQSLDVELSKVQERKNIDRALLIRLCQEEENNSNEIVNKILNVKRDQQMQYSKEWEKERKTEEEMLLSCHIRPTSIEKKVILASMEELMREEIAKIQNIRADRQSLVIKSLASEVAQQNCVLKDIIEKRVKDQAHLFDTLRQNEELQKSAVASLLEKSDAASWELVQQILFVEAQLVEITRLELSKRQLESECQLNELSKNRIALTELLSNLFERQTLRRNHLIDTMRKMESLRDSIKDSENFWMEQYDKLLNSRGHEMVKFLEGVNPQLVYELFLNGVFHYLPLLKDFVSSENALKTLDDIALIKLGIKNSDDRFKILRAIKSFLNNQIVPTAPLLEEPSAPVLQDTKQPSPASYLVPDECVICLERKPNIIFIPCGHICCCYKCFKSVTLCPLCRTEIKSVHERLV